MTDLEYMQRALDLAAVGRGRVSPNPMVGALVVKDGEIVGRGSHIYAELKHAEVIALEEAGERARGATLYLNLEPCSHHGRTPPCAEAVVRSGVSRVVVAMEDPNPLVSGRGLALLKEAGIEVAVGLCETEARRLNEIFITYVTRRRPFVLLKIATTLDGKIATRTWNSRWITGEEARQASQLLRVEYDAILVGVGTVIADDPELTVRIKHHRHRPLARVVLDGRLRTPLHCRLVSTARAYPLIIFADEAEARAYHGLRFTQQVEKMRQCGAEVVFTDAQAGRVNLGAMLTELGKRQIASVIVEGGGEVSGQFLTAGLIDKVTFFIAPKLVGGRAAVPAIAGEGFEYLAQAVELAELTVKQHGRDIEVTGYPAAFNHRGTEKA